MAYRAPEGALIEPPTPDQVEQSKGWSHWANLGLAGCDHGPGPPAAVTRP
jgi:hypothetical protein